MHNLMRKLAGVAIITLSSIALATAPSSQAAERTTTQTMSTTVEIIGTEAFAKELRNQGVNENSIQVIIEFDAQIETARHAKASKQEIQQIMDNFNQKLADASAKDPSTTSVVATMAQHSASIFACCGVGVKAFWTVDSGSVAGYYRNYQQEWYGGSGSCSGTCNYSQPFKLPGDWEYHLAIGNNIRGHSAACM